MTDAKIQLVKHISKDGHPYFMLHVYIESPDGELVRIHKIYVKRGLKEILEYLQIPYVEG